MNPYYNLPPEQHAMQRVVDQVNADEEHWRKLVLKRIAWRILQLGKSKKKLKKADLTEFSKSRPPQDCIGTPLKS